MRREDVMQLRQEDVRDFVAPNGSERLRVTSHDVENEACGRFGPSVAPRSPSIARLLVDKITP